MRILHVHTRYRRRGGEDAVVDGEVAMLRDAGHDVIEWRLENPESAVGAIVALAQAPSNRSSAQTMRRMVRASRPDVIHIHNTWFAMSPSVLARPQTAGVPTVMTLHNYRLLCAGGELVRDGEPCERCVGSHPWHSVYYGCFRQSRIASVPAAATISINRRRRTWVDNVDRFAALTSFARSRFVAGGLPEEKIEVLPNVVADPGPRNSPPSDSDVVLFVGRLTAVKGVATLARAWESARPRGLRLRVIGAGPLAGAFEGVPGVELTGWLSPEQVRAEMLQARALVFPSEWYEGMPMTLLEAFAAGLPVVGSQIGSVAEIVGRSGAEWLVRPGDVDAWAEAFGRLAAGSGLATASATVRSVFERDHTTAAGLERLVSLYTGARAVSG